ncbi:SLBB domain-containing protein [bacterium]|nr:SLBB domain-containing protein [candidate division CSSED10-310 bacterium]
MVFPSKHLKFFLLVTFILLISIMTSIAADGYKLGPSDVIRVLVTGKHDYRLDERVKVSNKGTIVLSIMNDEMNVKGLTAAQVDEQLTPILAKDYIIDPEVMIEVVEYNSHKILVLGEVKRPGELTIEKEKLPIKELLLQTGGTIGDLSKNVVVIHSNPAPGQKPDIFSLDQVLMDNADSSFSVQADDIVYVIGKDKSLPIQDYDEVVYVFGEVKSPGLIPYSSNLTTLRAILNAGNFTKEAAPGRTFIKRRNESDSIDRINVDLDKVMSGGDKSVDIEVKPGDVIYVPRAIF